MPSRSRKQWLDAALLYAANGWYVLPLHAFTSRDCCDCGDRRCDRRGGHPWTDFWHGEASRCEEDIISWAEMEEGARRLAIVIGPASRLVALVVEGGETDRLAPWTDAFGPLPTTVAYRDAGREVYLFRLPASLAAVVPKHHAWEVELAEGVVAHVGTAWISAPTSLDTSDVARYDWIGHAAYVPAAEPPPWFLWQTGLITEREFDRLENGAGADSDGPAEGAPAGSSDGAASSGGAPAGSEAGGDPDALDLVVHPAAGHPFVIAPEDAAPESHTLGFTTARDLLALHREAPLHVAGAWALTHALSVLAGAPKVAGASTFLLSLARAVLAGAPFLGAPTRQAPVVLVSDRNARPLAHALRAAGIDDPAAARHLHLFTRDRIRDLHLSFDHVVELAAEHARRVGAELVVVDGVDRLAGLDVSDPGTDWRPVVRPLDAAASDGAAVIASVHGGGGFADIRSVAARLGALAAAADVFMTLAPAPAQHADDRVLSALSRFPDTPATAHLRYEGGAFRRLGPELYPLFHTAGVDVPDTRPSEAEASFRITTLLQSAGVA